jgi:hypothetical protein
MTQDYTLYTYKRDRRIKAGERLVATAPLHNTEEEMQYVVAKMSELFPAAKGWRFEYHPSKVTVKNLMTGADVEIDRDTPWCCNPASETYWSM